MECGVELWQELVEFFGKDVVVTKRDYATLNVRVTSIASVMRSWILQHINECDVIGPKKFRDEIQRTIMEAYNKYLK